MNPHCTRPERIEGELSTGHALGVEISGLISFLKGAFTRESAGPLLELLGNTRKALPEGGEVLRDCGERIKRVGEAKILLEVAPAPCSLVKIKPSRGNLQFGQRIKDPHEGKVVLRYDQIAAAGGPSWELLGHSRDPATYSDLNHVVSLALRGLSEAILSLCKGEQSNRADSKLRLI